jgi:hypothetical protein
MQPEILDISRKPIRRPKGNRNEQNRRQPLPDALIRVIDLLVESRIKLDALEHVLKETNPLVHEFYLGTIENLRAHKSEEVNRVLTQTLKSNPTER